LGKALLNKRYERVGINIDKTESGEVSFNQIIANLASATSDLINSKHQFGAQDITLDGGYVGEGYGVIGDREKEAIALTARYEGILLDPVYTGRAMGALIDMVRSGKLNNEHKVLFWHTGGAPSLFAYADSLDTHHQ
jgi:1-aminocyclopropane-1-carboxylate deaminase/D-cysteine desulfhydrase-like pyridoxal-dependent ACC family enzyme